MKDWAPVMWLTYIFIVDGKKTICYISYITNHLELEKTLYNRTEQLYNLYNLPTLTRRLHVEL